MRTILVKVTILYLSTTAECFTWLLFFGSALKLLQISKSHFCHFLCCCWLVWLSSSFVPTIRISCRVFCMHLKLWKHQFCWHSWNCCYHLFIDLFKPGLYLLHLWLSSSVSISAPISSLSWIKGATLFSKFVSSLSRLPIVTRIQLKYTTYSKMLSLIVISNFSSFHRIAQICYLIWIHEALQQFSGCQYNIE